MSGAREKILREVRAACRTARVPKSESPELSPSLLPETEWPGRFRSELEALQSRCTIVQSEAELQALVRSEIEGKTVLCWDLEKLPYALAEHVSEATQILGGTSPSDAKASAEVGLTGVTLAAAETGSIVLLPGPGEPRTASLLPLKHVAIVRRDQLRADLAQCFAELQGHFGDSSQVNVITGQSRSADIELSLILGMHGPAELHVIVGP